MSTEAGIYWLQQALEAIVVLSGPVLMGALIIGLLIAVFQAVTTIQEMTLAYVPKMIVVVVILFFPLWLYASIRHRFYATSYYVHTKYHIITA